MKTVTLLIPAIIALLATGCGTISGLDASSGFSCKAAPGVTCQSISGVHQNASSGNLPFQRNGDVDLSNTANDQATKEEDKPAYGTSRSDIKSTSDSKVSPRDMSAAYSGMPVRQPPLVLRVWMAPYEDEGGDLHDQSYFYTMVHTGKWMIEANRNAISNQFRPIYPLNRPTHNQETSPDKEVQPLNRRGNNENTVEKPD